MEELTPNLMVDDVNETIEYYQKHLGFELVMTVPEEGKFFWAMLQCGKISLMFQEKQSILAEYPMLKPAAGGLTFYIKVKDVTSLFAKVKGKVNIVSDLHKTFYGAEEFALQDPNGFVLNFAGDAGNPEE